MDEITALDKAHIKVRCAEIAIQNGTKVGIERDACLKQAEKIYKFALGITEDKAPDENKDNG